VSLLAADLDAARKCWRNFAAKQMGALFDPKSADPQRSKGERRYRRR